jgi:uncharacterized repeat protein (TIGR04138 family)
MLARVVAEMGIYPIEAFDFVHDGLHYTVRSVYGEITDPAADLHVTGQQLCQGLREYALLRWGLMASSVLHRWNITSTLDFGNIVFSMIRAGHMRKRPQDCIEDFANVYDFQTGFEVGYQIPSQL